MDTILLSFILEVPGPAFWLTMLQQPSILHEHGQNACFFEALSQGIWREVAWKSL